MSVYRFRVTFDEYDDITREIDIKAIQSFKDLHLAILHSIGFDQKHGASFFVSDDMWRWGAEFVSENELQQTGMDGKKKTTGLALMEKKKIVNSIEDPHQKFIYVYDYVVQWLFHVELVRILSPDASKTYPYCSRSMGTAPKQYKVVLPPPEEEEEELSSLLGNGKKEKTILPDEEEPVKEVLVEQVEGLDEEDLEIAKDLIEDGAEDVPGADEEATGSEDPSEDREEL